MKEIRIHGRQGQGNTTAAYLLEQAALLSGNFAQAVVSLGPTCAHRQVTARVQIFRMGVQLTTETAHPDFLILQDHTLLHSLGVADDLPPATRLLVNWAEPITPTTMKGRQIVLIPADFMAMEFIGKPMPNTALLAALISLTGLLPLEALENAVATHFRGEDLERNLKLVRYAAHAVPAGIWNESGAGSELPVSPQSLLH
jgi:pyruvate ferredoxin oxidoreductase gamma subunit